MAKSTNKALEVEEIQLPANLDRQAERDLILAAIDKFIEVRKSEWGDLRSQVGEFNPYVTRYDMLQKFRKAIAQGELLSQFPELSGSLVERVFPIWQKLASLAVGQAIAWGHPISLKSIYMQLDHITWDEFLSELAQINQTEFELVPSRVKNWMVGDRQVGALTFHRNLGIDNHKVD
ncbi:hypothetical protein ACKFKG_22825 [Phormidesmis sp. 146-35]